MIEIVHNIIQTLTAAPKKLFLTDSLGAALTAFFMFVILKSFNQYVGMPETILTYLSLLAASFSLYSAICFFLLKEKRASFIQGIAVANILYCVLTLFLLIIYYKQLTIIGITYFSVEIAIVCGLAYIEFCVAKAIDTNKR
jgi:ABC-type transport system involved in cytochrome c biogenesis permease subunit